MKSVTSQTGGTPSARPRKGACLPFLPMLAGVLLLFSGFVYDVMFAGIPYQDPTPEMSARYALHTNIARVLYLTGFGMTLFGAVTGVVRRFGRGSSNPDPAQ